MLLDAAIAPLSDWANFYVIVGSASAGLTGLMFVVITLMTSVRLGGNEPVGAFSTPTVVHFSLALLVAAVLSAPWHTLVLASLTLVGVGLGGIGYTYIVFRRTLRQTTYEPVFEDWLWHVALPFGSYGVLFVCALILAHKPTIALFGIGAAALLLIFIGIHNAWDTVTYLVTDYLPRRQAAKHDTQHDTKQDVKME